MKLFGYYRSSAAYRLRIALNLKGVTADPHSVRLRRGEQALPRYRSINPFGLVPALEHNGQVFTQSLAIIEYLEEILPQPALLPSDARDRAYVRSIALSIACDIHPLNNLRVLNYLKDELALETASRDRWYAHWIRTGLSGLETFLAGDSRVGTYCFGDVPGLADICLVPQMYNAERMKCDISDYPTLRRITAAARTHPAFRAAEPEAQPDAE
jgi:maleylpyruvate isomerase